VATLQVELVAVERKIWSGEAERVIARTTEGELGVLPGHAPLLGQLADGGVVTIRVAGGEDVVVAAHGGFLSVSDQGVSILAETAEISTEIDVERAREALRRAESEGDDPEAIAAARRAQSRLQAAGASATA
jgi:F-type H+-transporting ATPase subunit epsilon